MFTTWLFIAIMISGKAFTMNKLPRFSNTKLQVNTKFLDEGENDKPEKKINYHYEPGKRDEYLETFYSLIWFDCDDCKELLKDIKNGCKQLAYIDGGYYFFDKDDKNSTPLFYKNDELIATDVFSIYEEMFFKKINEETEFDNNI
jgi:hypothetical protein